MPILIAAAISKNNAIGYKGDLPWNIPSDLKRFKALTIGKPIIMGRKTFESIGRPLPGRLNIVLSSNKNYRKEGVEVVYSKEKALEVAKECKNNTNGEIFIIGGSFVFEEFLSKADRLHITHVLADIEGDVFFPTIDPAVWDPVFSTDFLTNEEDSHPTRYIIYNRKA